MLPANFRGKTIFGRVLSYRQWLANADGLLKYYLGYGVDVLCGAHWHSFWESGVCVSLAVHWMMQEHGLEAPVEMEEY